MYGMYIIPWTLSMMPGLDKGWSGCPLAGLLLLRLGPYWAWANWRPAKRKKVKRSGVLMNILGVSLKIKIKGEGWKEISEIIPDLKKNF